MILQERMRKSQIYTQQLTDTPVRTIWKKHLRTCDAAEVILIITREERWLGRSESTNCVQDKLGE